MLNCIKDGKKIDSDGRTVINTHKVLDLSITKDVTGNMADLSKPFSFTVMFNYGGASPIEFSLSDGDTSTINNVLAGSTITLKK